MDSKIANFLEKKTQLQAIVFQGSLPRSISLRRGTAPSRLSFFAQPLSYTAHYYNVRHNSALVSSFITANVKTPCMSSMAKIALFSLSCKPFHVFNMFFPFFLHSVFHLLYLYGRGESRKDAGDKIMCFGIKITTILFRSYF